MTATSLDNAKQSWCQTVLFSGLAFWLSGSLILDGLVMPSLYASGMMTEPGFASAGYSMFWLFNRVELLCAGLVLTCVLVLRYSRTPLNRPGQLTLLLSVLLVTIAWIDTYQLTPSMSALGLQLNWFTAFQPPAGMNQLHISYWFLESLKLAAVSGLLWFYYRLPISMTQE